MITKNRIVATSLGLIVSAGAFMLLPGNSYGPDYYQAYKPSDKTFFIGSEDGEKNESAKGHSDYMSLIMANPYTGDVAATDVKKAIDQAENNPAYKRKRSDHITWQNQGPDNIGGRTRAILVDNQNKRLVYAGGVSGGLWKSENSGSSWEAVSYEGADQYKSLAIVCMEQASNGDIYFGTGEQGFAYQGAYKDGFGGKTGHMGMGMWKSTDGGKTWKHLKSTIPQNPYTQGGTAWSNIHELAIDADNPQRIFAGTDRGLRVSEDGGNTWNKIDMGSSGQYTNATFLEVNCSPNGNTVFAATESKLFRSTDDGNSFKLVNDREQNTLPTFTLGRIETAISPSDNQYVYITCVNSGETFGSSDDLEGVYQSRNNGKDWEPIAKGGSFFDPFSRGGNVAQGSWDNVIAVDPSQKDRIFVGGIFFWLWDGSGDGDAQGEWSQAASSRDFSSNKRYMHVDHHEISFNMESDPPIMYVGNDGGIFRTRGDFTQKDKPKYKEVNTGYNTAQFYAMDASKRGDVIGGTQDNNTVYRLRNGYTGKSYERAIGGDGFYCEISDMNNDVYIGESQGANVGRSQDAGGSVDILSFEDINNKDRKSPFNTPFRLYENRNDTLSQDSVAVAAPEAVVMAEDVTFTKDDTIPKKLLTNAQKLYFSDNPVNFKEETITGSKEVILQGDTLDIKKEEEFDGFVVLRNLANVDPNNFQQVGVNSFSPTKDLAELPGNTIKVLSKNGLEYEYTFKKGLEPLETVQVQDPIRTLFTMPLRNEIWLTPGMLDFGSSPSWFKLTNVSLQTPLTLAYTPDGNTVFVGGWDNNISRVFRITGLRHAYFQKGAFDRSKLDVKEIQTFQNVVTGVSVNPNNEDELLVTCGNYGTGDHVFYSENATDTIQPVSFEKLDDAGPSEADLPTMPVYDGLFRMDSANQVFVGTEMGMWFLDLDKRSQGWLEVNQGMPRVPVHQLRQIKPAEWAAGPRIYAATHGRGIYYTSSTNPNSGVDEWNKDESSNFEPEMQVYPNPARTYTNVDIDIPEGANGQLQMVNMRGKVVKNRMVSGQPGTQQLRFQVSGLENGNYILRMSGNDFDKNAKLTVSQ